MFAAAVAAQHAPKIQTGVAGSPAAGPAPAPSPRPPGDTPIAFSVVSRDAVFAIVGTSIGTVTLATVTCADASMTLALSDTVPGLTFSYSANVLTVSGTPTGTTKTVRVVASYIASDGSNQVRGSSTHTFTVVNATEVLTIGSMANPTIKAGRVESVVLASPSANYNLDVYARAEAFIPSLRNRTTNAPQAVPVSPSGSYLGSFSADLTWTPGSPTSSGTVTLSGCFPPVGYDPSANWSTGLYTFEVGYYARGSNVFLGRSTHSVTVTPAHDAAPAPAPPSPAPPAPAPSPPPAPTPAPAPGTGPDPLYSSVRFLFRFDDATDIAKDEKGGIYVATGVTSGTGAVRGGGVFASGGKVEGSAGGYDLTPGALTIDAVVNVGATAWDALMASGSEKRWLPVVTMLDDQGRVVWSVGFEGSQTIYGTRDVRVVAAHQLDRPSTHPLTTGFPSIASARLVAGVRPGRFVRLCMVQKQEAGSVSRIGVWVDGVTESNAFTVANNADLRQPQTGVGPPAPGAPAPRLLIGGACPALYGFSGGLIGAIVPFEGVIDEVRGTDATRHADKLGATSFTIPEADRVIPWPNY